MIEVRQLFIRLVPMTFPDNPCLGCGACCAFYRVSFYWSEADSTMGGSVPDALTERLDLFLSVMKGTNSDKPFCAALQGSVGEHVFCGIYDRRPSVCREFPVAGEPGACRDLCDRARTAWGMAPLTSSPSGSPENFPKAA